MQQAGDRPPPAPRQVAQPRARVPRALLSCGTSLPLGDLPNGGLAASLLLARRRRCRLPAASRPSLAVFCARHAPAATSLRASRAAEEAKGDKVEVDDDEEFDEERAILLVRPSCLFRVHSRLFCSVHPACLAELLTVCLWQLTIGLPANWLAVPVP